MLSQQIRVQSSLSDQSLILSSVPSSNRQFVQSQVQIQQCADNCPQNIRQHDGSQNCSSYDQIKIKLQKLYETYQKAVDQLAFHEQKYEAEENVRIQLKNKLKASLNQIYQNQQLRNRKGSQISTAGQDEENRTHFQQNQTKRGDETYETIMMMKKKLQELRNKNATEIQRQYQIIAQLKSRLLAADKLAHSKNQNIKAKSTINVSNQEIEHKICQLKKRKQQLTNRKQNIESKIREQTITITQLQNSTQYLRSTQSCCQQILNEQLNSIKYKISTRRAQYDTTKKYMDKIIRSRKYQESVSFKQTKNQIQYLNDYCDDMINKKSQIISQIKKYKHKRRAITDQIKQNYELVKEIQIKKYALNQNIHQQNVQYVELQEQYCLMIENMDQKTLTMSQDLSPQQKCQILNQKKQILSQQLKSIVSLSIEAKFQIQSNHNLVPKNIIKDLQKKIKKKKYQTFIAENLQKKITQLQVQNKLLNQQKDQIQWKTNPDLQKLIQQEKTFIFDQNSLKDSLKSLKQENQSLQEKILKFQQYIKAKKQETNNKETSQTQKSNFKVFTENKNLLQQKRQYDGQKLMQKFRQKKSKLDETNENQNDDSELNQSQISFRKNNGKRVKHRNSNLGKQQKQMSRSKGKGFYLAKQNPIVILKKKFPINRSEQTFSNSSLLASNPALWMFIFFVLVVIPGLCIGYNF